MLKQLYGVGPHGKELRSPANTHPVPACQPGEGTLLKVDPPALSQDLNDGHN